MNKFKFIVISFLIWRIFLFVPLILVFYFVSYRSGQEFTNILYTINFEPSFRNILLIPWANFDGVHYLNIASRGYLTEARFFPLFPLSIALLSAFLEPRFSSILLVSIAFLTGLVFFYKLIKETFDSQIAKNSIFYMLIFPTSFFFASIYSESLFFMLTILSFYFATKRQWFLSAVSGLLLTLTRVVGVAVIPALIWEFFEQEKLVRNKFRRGWSLLLMPLGILGYSLFNLYKWGDGLYFLKAHSELGNSRSSATIILPIQTIVRYIKIFFTVSARAFEYWIALLEFLTFFFIAFLIYVAWKKNLKKSFLVFMIIAFMMPVLSGTFTALPRYILVLFPLFITIALIKHRVFKMLYISISVILLVILTALFSRGYFVA